MKNILQYVPVTAWLLSLVAVPWFPAAVYLVIATTLNLIHHRWTLYHSGTEFTRRVHNVLSDKITEWELRIAAMEKRLVDVQEAQIKIGGAFTRGRP